MNKDRQSGLEPDFLRLYQSYAAALRRLCGAYSRDPAGQQDVLQEIALAIWTALPNYRADASERTWIYRIAHNVAITYSARQRRRQWTEQSMETMSVDPAIVDDAQHRALLEAVQQLKPVDRNIVILYLEGLAAREIGDVMGLSTENVAVRMSRLRRKLALTLRGEEA
jgi:RNA polymerase sigma factor (sigma-70 family)